MEPYRHLDGTSFCIVYLTVLDAATQQVKLSPFHGTARVLPDRVLVEDESNGTAVVPDSALASIHPSDGNEILKDADYFVVVRVHDRSDGIG